MTDYSDPAASNPGQKADHHSEGLADIIGMKEGHPRLQEAATAWPRKSPEAMTAYQAEQVLQCCAGDLGADSIRAQVERALATPSVTNVVQNYLTALRHGLSRRLTNQLLDFIRHNFVQICETKGFLNLPPEVVTVMLRDNHLAVNSELDVYVAALNWLDYNKQDRLQHAVEVMRCVRFSFLSPSDVVKYVEPNRGLFEGDGKDILLSIYRTHMMILAGLQAERVEPPRNYQTPAEFLGLKYVYFKPDNNLDEKVNELHTSFLDTSGNHYPNRTTTKDKKPGRFHFSLSDQRSHLKDSIASPSNEGMSIGQNMGGNYIESVGRIPEENTTTIRSKSDGLVDSDIIYQSNDNKERSDDIFKERQHLNVTKTEADVVEDEDEVYSRNVWQSSLAKRVRDYKLNTLVNNDVSVWSEKGVETKSKGDGNDALVIPKATHGRNLDSLLRNQIQASWSRQGDPKIFDGKELKNAKSSDAEKTHQTGTSERKDKVSYPTLPPGYFGKSDLERSSKEKSQHDPTSPLDVITSVNDSLDRLLSNVKKISLDSRKDINSLPRPPRNGSLPGPHTHSSDRQTRNVSFDLIPRVSRLN